MRIYNNSEENESKIFNIFVGYNVVLLLLGLFWSPDTTYLKSVIAWAPSFFFPLVLFYFKEASSLLYYIKWLSNIILPIYILDIIFTYLAYGSFRLLPIESEGLALLILFQKCMSKREKLLLWSFAAYNIATNYIYGNRAAILYMAALFLIYIISHIHHAWRWEKWIVWALPAICTFYIFNSVTNLFLKDDADSFFNDSRTFLYNEVTTHLKEHDAILWGTTPGIGYQTSLRYVIYRDMNTGKDNDEAYKALANGRMHSESQLLNYFHWGGLINVTLFAWMMFVFLSKLDFSKDRNRLAVCIYFYLIYRALYTYVEGLQNYMIENISFWLAMALIGSQLCYHSQEEIEEEYNDIEVTII